MKVFENKNNKFVLTDEFIKEKGIVDYVFLGGIVVYTQKKEVLLSNQLLPLKVLAADVTVGEISEKKGTISEWCWGSSHLIIAPNICLEGNGKYFSSAMYVQDNGESTTTNFRHCATDCDEFVSGDNCIQAKKSGNIVAFYYIGLSGNLLDLGNFPEDVTDITQSDAGVFVRTTRNGKRFLTLTSGYGFFHSTIAAADTYPYFRGSFQYKLLLHNNQLYWIDFKNHTFDMFKIYDNYTLRQLLYGKLYILDEKTLIFIIHDIPYMIAWDSDNELLYAALSGKEIALYSWGDEEIAKYDISLGIPMLID